MMFRVLGAVVSVSIPWATAYADEPVAVQIDFGIEVGEIRPLHGVNGGPMCRGETVDLRERWRELRIPVTRLHDPEWPRPDIVDLHSIFPDPAADPDDPAAYSFAKTDDYVGAVIESGAKIVYRLGESIEHTRTKYHVHPPEDPERWAAACLGVVRRYNEGWADGKRYGIGYWEVWNEPENRPACWTGTDEDYFRLYAATARTIKVAYPTLKIGGPAAGAVGEVIGDEFTPTPFIAGFIDRCRRDALPLDFFSWHHYGDDPATVVNKGRAIRKWLDEQGFPETEIHLNEWNYLPDGDWSPLLAEGQGERRRAWNARMQGIEGATYAACVLCGLQDASIDVANFYRGDAGSFGLFDEHGTPTKAFFAFKAFRMMLDTPRRVMVRGGETERTALLAGLAEDSRSATVLVVNSRAGADRFAFSLGGSPWEGPTRCEIDVLDQHRDLERIEERSVSLPEETFEVSLPASAIAVIRLHGIETKGERPAVAN